MERHFSCTACGKCCHGWLPLSIGDALRHADKFPLVVAWTPVRQGGRSFGVTADLGITVKLKAKRRQAAVRISPTAYIPPSFACPELTGEGLCGIHAEKPQRCQTMPFSGYRDETDQDDLLVPRHGWLCDVSRQAPLVYRDKAIVERLEFERERAALVDDAAILKPYAQWLLDSSPSLMAELGKAALRPAGGQVLVAFATLVPRLAKVDIYDFAEKQYPVMQAFAARTAADPSLADYHRLYSDAAVEWEKVARQRS